MLKIKTAANGPGHSRIPHTVATFLSWRGFEALDAWYLLLMEDAGNCTQENTFQPHLQFAIFFNY